MRTAVVFFAGKNRDKLLAVSKSLALGMESQGHTVALIDGEKDNTAKLTMYEYLALGTESVSLFTGKIPDKIAPFLASSGMISGKRSFAFVIKSGLSYSKALLRLMKAMEHEGMYIRNSNIFLSAQEAEEVGKRLHIQSR